MDEKAPGSYSLIGSTVSTVSRATQANPESGGFCSYRDSASPQPQPHVTVQVTDWPAPVINITMPAMPEIPPPPPATQYIQVPETHVNVTLDQWPSWPQPIVNIPEIRLAMEPGALELHSTFGCTDDLRSLVRAVYGVIAMLTVILAAIFLPLAWFAVSLWRG